MRKLSVGSDIFILGAIFVFAAFSSAHACSPLPGYSSDPESLRTQAQEVFLGRVGNVTVDESKGLITAQFRVSRVWKGSRARARTVVTYSDEAACGLGAGFFVKGRRYVVYANRNAGVRSASLLGGTKDLAHGANDLRRLGPGVVLP